MVKIEDMIQAAKQLSPEDRAELIRRLIQEAWKDEADDHAVGERGIRLLAESTRNEDWSEFYPPSLKNRRRSA